MRQSASVLYSEVLTKRDLGIALFIKCLMEDSRLLRVFTFFALPLAIEKRHS